MAFANASASQFSSSSILHEEPRLASSSIVLKGAPLSSRHRLPFSCNDKAGRMVVSKHPPLFAIRAEPILTLRHTECITREDNLTTLTANGCPAAQFEHTILSARTGAEILTKC